MLTDKEIAQLSYEEFTQIKKKHSKIGRPKKYQTEEERLEARKQSLIKYKNKNK